MEKCMKQQTIDIIAELAQGYEGSIEQALLLLKAAKSAGADAAKYQVIYADELCTPDYKHYSLFQSLEMPDEAWERIVVLAQKLEIRLIFDIFGDRSLALAEKLSVSEIMVHATDLTNMPLIEKIAASSAMKVFLGVGGALMSEIERTVKALHSKQVVVMIGFQGYPTPDHENQISRIGHVLHELAGMHSAMTIGFADHSLPQSRWVLPFSSIALGLGARVFEKHLTLGEVMKLEDYEAAINPDRFAHFSRGLRICATAMGIVKPVDDFGMYPSEMGYRQMVRRSVVAAIPLAAGAKIIKGDVILKRSAKLGDYHSLESVVGSTLLRAVEVNQPLRSGDV
jgi:sialic acid synthase SpsE